MNKKLFFFILVIFLIINSNYILHINDFVYLKNSEFSDIPISHYPNLVYIQNGIVNDHEIPLWSNLLFSGYPLIENPISGIWYIWGWIALIFPLPLGINLNLLIHMLLGIFGMFLFLNKEGRSDFAAIFGALSFGLSTKIISHLGAGHLSMIYAVVWTPWLLYFTKLGFLKNSKISKILPGIIIGFIISADPRWIIPSGLLWLFYLLLNKESLKERIILFFSSGIIGLTTSIGTWFSLINYLNYATRVTMSPEERNIYALNLSNLLGFFFPEFGGFSEHVLYPTAIVFLLVILGIFFYKNNREIRFWYFVIMLSILLSFGEAIPLLRHVFSLPGFTYIRVPSRFLWLTFLSFSIIASFMVDQLMTFRKTYRFDRMFFLIPISVFILLFFIGVFLITGRFNFNLLMGLLFFIAGTVFIGLILHEKISTDTKKIGFIFLIILDLFLFNLNSVRYENFQNVFENKPNLISRVKTLPESVRIYTPSYSLSQEEAAYWNINQINGIDPMQLRDYVDYFEKVSGIKNLSYSVTLPPFQTGNPKVDNITACPNKDLLVTLNVGLIISDYELQNCLNFSDYEIIDEKFVYSLDYSNSTAFLQDNETEIELISYIPNQILLRVNQGGRLYFKEIHYPGWQAFVNGTKTTLGKNGIFRYIDLPEGENLVELRFHPEYINLVLGIQLLSYGFILFLIILEQINVRKK